MPVTARLSQRFYEKLGDDVANELVEWFNAVDLAYRTELRELNELNFVRFDAKLEQRIAELRAELRQEMAEFKAEIRQEIAAFKAEVRSEIAALRAEVHGEIHAVRSSFLRWMFGFWVTTLLALAGLMATLLHAGAAR